MSETRREMARMQLRSTERGKLATLRARWLALALCLLWIASMGIAQAQLLSQTELQKLLASDGAVADSFGISVALSADRALVGAYRGDAAVSDSGAAYVYERDGTGMWVEVAKLIASDAAVNDEFGISVALSGNRALVGSQLDDDAGSESGAAYVYERDDTGTWVEVAKLIASDASADDLFGYSVALLGDRALVGAYRDDDAGTNSGSAYVYEPDRTGTWVEVAKFTASDGATYDQFGWSVALSGNRALVGALQHDTGGQNQSGSAYVYERDEAGKWVQMAKLTASDTAAGDYFGSAVALSGDRALVGAYLDVDSGSQSGSAYLYEHDGTGTWVEVAKLTASDAAGRDYFGVSVALSGDRALVGAYLDDDAGFNSGSAYVYEPNRMGTWVQVAKLSGSDAAETDFFGYSVALSSDSALVGARLDKDAGNGSGSAYVFDVAALGDGDEDGILDAEDNCPADMNPLQENFDEDLLGDVCDLDDDNDGVDDIFDAFPLDPTRPGGGGLPPLILDSVDFNRYGFRYEGVNSHREILERNFDASSSDLLLTLTGFDIDVRQEVRVLVNGNPIGFLSGTPNNNLGPTQLTIAQNLLNSKGNTLRFEQLNSGWRWGVTDLLLSASSVPLVLDVVDSKRYGFRFEGINGHREILERKFDASGSDLLLTLTGFDIDIRQEVRVFVNGTPIGFLSGTPNNRRGPTQLIIAQSLLNSDSNTLRFEQLNPGWRWGVTDLLLSARDSAM